MASKWFCVKTFYRSTASGAPRKPDRFFDPDATLLEERIQLMKATSRTEAIKKSEKDAKEYAKAVNYKNPYEQNVQMQYTGMFDIFEIDGNINDRKEVFITSQIVSRKVNDQKLKRVYVPRPEKNLEQSKRKKFINKMYLNQP